MTGGYTGKILRLNLTNRSVSTIETSKYEEYGGGHGIGSAIYWDLVEDKSLADGFDPRNVVTIMPGPLAGTLVPGAARCELQGIGPQGYPIEWFTRSNFGGRFAPQLKYAGWDGIVIEGKSDSPVWVNIVNDQVTFENASSLWGLNTWETQEEIWRAVTGNARFGEWLEAGNAYTTQRPAVICIGQAGENLSRIATLIHDGGSAAGQGGFGGVFGSKNLKAISVIGTGSIAVADPQGLLEAWLWHRTNFQYNVDEPKRESPIPNFPMYALINSRPACTWLKPATEPSRPQSCQGCSMGCRVRTRSGLSNDSMCMETIWYSSPDPKVTKRAADLSQQYGLNVMQLQSHYIRELNKMGVLGPGKKIESNLPFDRYGTLEFCEAYMRELANREGIGDDLAEGLARAAERWGRYEEDTNSSLLKLPNWGYHEHYDPRFNVEWGYGSILGSRDLNEHCFNRTLHWIPNAADMVGEEPLVSAERLVSIVSSKMPPYEGDPFMFDYSEGPTGIYSDHCAKMMAWLTHYTGFWKGSINYCDLVWPTFICVNAPDLLGPTPEGEPKFLNAVTGKGTSFVDGMEIGRKIWNLDRAIWVLQGRHRDMEVFTGYVYNVPSSSPWKLPVYENGKWSYSPCTGRTLDKARFEEWKTRFFKLEGWDTSTGWATRETLEELGLGKVADELQAVGRLGT